MNIKMIMMFVCVIWCFSGCEFLAPEPNLDMAETYVDEGDIEKGIEVYEVLIDEDEENHDAWAGLVTAYYEDREYEDAVDVMDDWLEVIEDQYEDGDDDYEDGLEAYNDMADDLLDKDEYLQIQVPQFEMEQMNNSQASVSDDDLESSEYELGAFIYTIDENMALNHVMTFSKSQFEDTFDLDFDANTNEMVDAISALIGYFSSGFEVVDVERSEQHLIAEIHIDDAAEFFAPNGPMTLEEASNTSNMTGLEDFMYYMNVVDYETGAPVGIEALQSEDNLYVLFGNIYHDISYFTVPGEILMMIVPGEGGYERIDENTVKYEEDQHAGIIFKMH